MSDRWRCDDDAFPRPDYEAWRTLAARESGKAPDIRRTCDELDVLPLYARDVPAGVERWAEREGRPGRPPFVRGDRAEHRAWDVRQACSETDAVATRDAIEEELDGGATSIRLNVDPIERVEWESEPSSKRATRRLSHTCAFFDAILPSDRPVPYGTAIDGGAYFLPVAALLLAGDRGHPDRGARGTWCADPIGALARDGRLPYPIDWAMRWVGELVREARSSTPHVRTIRVDTTPYHLAGATDVQDIAVALATGLCYLRALHATGLAIDEIAPRIEFHIAIDARHFASITKIRALRGLWSEILTAVSRVPSFESRGSSRAAGASPIHVQLGDRERTRIDTRGNLLRNASALFAAAVGGASIVTSVPHDAAIGPPSASSRRIARHAALLARDEGRLGRVADPAGGSWFLVDRTRGLARGAWSVFQEIERRGGIVAALGDGWIAETIEAAHARRADAIARRATGIIGVSDYPTREEAAPRTKTAPPHRARTADAACLSNASITGRDREPPARPSLPAAIDLARRGASIERIAGELGFDARPVEIQPLARRRWAEPFERIREASAAWARDHGRELRAFLAVLGSDSAFRRSATFARSCLEVGGVEPIGGDTRELDRAVETFRSSGATILAICAADELDASALRRVRSCFASSGARVVARVERSEASPHTDPESETDCRFYPGCDLVSALRGLLDRAGIAAEPWA